MENEKRLDLIDRNELKKMVHLSGHGMYYDAYEVQEMPTVDAVEVVHGEWIGIQYDGYADGCPVYDLWECSECREEYESEGDPPPYNYCPNCGAKMDGGTNDA